MDLTHSLATGPARKTTGTTHPPLPVEVVGDWISIITLRLLLIDKLLNFKLLIKKLVSTYLVNHPRPPSKNRLSNDYLSMVQQPFLRSPFP